MSYRCQIKCATQLYKDIHYKGAQLVFHRVGTWKETLITELTPRNTRAPHHHIQSPCLSSSSFDFCTANSTVYTASLPPANSLGRYLVLINEPSLECKLHSQIGNGLQVETGSHPFLGPPNVWPCKAFPQSRCLKRLVE